MISNNDIKDRLQQQDNSFREILDTLSEKDLKLASYISDLKVILVSLQNSERRYKDEVIELRSNNKKLQEYSQKLEGIINDQHIRYSKGVLNDTTSKQ